MWERIIYFFVFVVYCYFNTVLCIFSNPDGTLCNNVNSLLRNQPELWPISCGGVAWTRCVRCVGTAWGEVYTPADIMSNLFIHFTVTAFSSCQILSETTKKPKHPPALLRYTCDTHLTVLKSTSNVESFAYLLNRYSWHITWAHCRWCGNSSTY